MSDTTIPLVAAGVPSIVDVTYGHVTPEDLWTEKDRWITRAEKLSKEWNKMPIEDQEIAKETVRQSLLRLADRVGDWLPDAWEPVVGDIIDVQVRLLFSDVQAERNALTAIAQKRADDRKLLEDATTTIQEFADRINSNG
mgnify:CR=1 FL=1